MSLAAIVDQKQQGRGPDRTDETAGSSAAKLTASVVDGIWKPGLYPKLMKLT